MTFYRPVPNKLLYHYKMVIKTLLLDRRSQSKNKKYKWLTHSQFHQKPLFPAYNVVSENSSVEERAQTPILTRKHYESLCS